jgi:predicted kinase
MTQTQLILLRGLPGSGKSTLAKSKYVPLGYIHLEADMYFERSGSYVFDPKLLGKAHGWCQYETKKNLQAGNNVVVTNTFTTMREINDYIKIANDVGVELKVIHAQGNFKNVHGVPDDKLAAMKARWQPFIGEEIYTP